MEIEDEGNEYEFTTQTSSNVAADIAKNSTILEEGPRVCPLCNSIVRLFYVDYTSKILMCENMKCEYPFGDEIVVYSSDDDGCFLNGSDLKIFNRKRTNRSSRSNRSVRSLGQSSRRASTIVTDSELCTTEWSEINRLNQAYDSDDSLTSSKIFTRKSSKRCLEKRAKNQEDEANIKQNVEKIKELNSILYVAEKDTDSVSNQNWIQNLSSWQTSSGLKLLKRHEIGKMQNKDNKNINLGELKIDVETRQDSISSIKIEIGGGIDKKT